MRSCQQLPRQHRFDLRDAALLLREPDRRAPLAIYSRAWHWGGDQREADPDHSDRADDDPLSRSTRAVAVRHRTVDRGAGVRAGDHRSRPGIGHIVLGYRTTPAVYWGMQHFLLEMVRLPRFAGGRAHDGPIQRHGRCVLLLAVVLTSLMRNGADGSLSHDRDRRRAYFLILTRLRYAVLGFCGAVDQCGQSILRSGLRNMPWHRRDLPVLALVHRHLAAEFDARRTIRSGAGPLFGLLAWATLIAFVWKSLPMKFWMPSRPRLLLIAIIPAFLARRDLARVNFLRQR